MRFSGAVKNGGGPQTGVAGVTFLLYKDQEGGAPLWIETQNVKLDSAGHYIAFIGSTKTDGLPIELFSSGEARWLGVQVEGQPEQPRVLLLSVPYALKAADAETLGGKPASAFSLAVPAEPESTSTTATGAKPSSEQVTANSKSMGTAGFIARWTSNKTLGNGILFFQDASGRVGIGTTTPLSLLHVNGIAQVGPGTPTPTSMLNVASSSPSVTGLSATGFTGPTSTAGMVVVGGESKTPAGTGANGLFATGGIGDGPGGTGGTAIVANGGPGVGPVGTGGAGIIAHGADGQGPSGSGGDGVVGIGGASFSSGVFGIGNSFDDTGVTGMAPGIGVHGESTETTGVGVFGVATEAGGVGVVGSAVPGSYAGEFNGDLNVTGAIFAGTKDFRIDHPLDPANKYLLHASVESSEMMDVYSGNTTLDGRGQATVRLPQWFEVVNTDFRYQLTSVGVPSPGLYVAKEIANHQFTIAGGSPGGKVSWQISAVRNDPYAKANPLVVEQAKRLRERGYYIHPALYGATAEKSIEWARHPYAMRKMKEFKTKQSSMKGASGHAK
ncbi:MAG TPA: hypothetical protein VJN48_13005, partial [Terriglobales bacterium]|nr:hypothetical protein [Terriglobales bacterium]